MNSGSSWIGIKLQIGIVGKVVLRLFGHLLSPKPNCPSLDALIVQADDESIACPSSIWLPYSSLRIDRSEVVDAHTSEQLDCTCYLRR